MKGNEALDALVALCDVERVEGTGNESTRNEENTKWSTPLVTVDGADQSASLSNDQNTSQTNNNLFPYIQFLQSQMLNSQHINNINNYVTPGNHSYPNSVSLLPTTGPQMQPPSNIASMNGRMYTQQAFLSLNPFAATPQNDIADSVIKSTKSESSSPNQAGFRHIALSNVDNKRGLSEDEEESDGHSHVLTTEVKRSNKRAANRLSAQLSRRRRKVFMEELKIENEKLRMKESILSSIPDLVIVFDSTGTISFVSKRVCKILSFTSDELQNCSFWDRLSDDNQRLVKAAFMDAISTKGSNNETVPLGQGMWEIQLLDKDLSSKPVVLHGVVHFLDENPQCICTIRPRDNMAHFSHFVQTDKMKESQNVNERKECSIPSSSNEVSSKDGDHMGKVNRNSLMGMVAQISDVESVMD